MDLFEEQEQKKSIQKTKEEYKKRSKRVLLILMLIFGILGAVFLALGLALMLTLNIFELYLSFLILGAVYLLVVLLLAIVLKCVSFDNLFDNYVNRAKNGRMIYSTFEMSTRILMLEEKVRKLEEEVESLRKNY